MIATNFIAFNALFNCLSIIFHGENFGLFALLFDTSDTSQKMVRYRLKPNAHAGCTPDTSDTYRKTEVHVKNTERGQKWASTT